jgi:peptidoglycan hydrolase CwlO-like protein
MDAQKSKLTDPAKLVALPGSDQAPNIERALGHIYNHLLKELEAKTDDIKELKLRIGQLEKRIQNYQYQVEANKTDIAHEKKQLEGSKQLINKLLGDIRNYQNDIEWYKRTYEKRSLLGILKQKLRQSN